MDSMYHQTSRKHKSAGSNRRMRKTARSVVWEGPVISPAPSRSTEGCHPEESVLQGFGCLQFRCRGVPYGLRTRFNVVRSLQLLTRNALYETYIESNGTENRIVTVNAIVKQLESLPKTKQDEVADFIEFLVSRCGKELEVRDNGSSTPTAFFGMRADCKEMADSAEWVRQLREKEWDRVDV